MLAHFRPFKLCVFLVVSIGAANAGEPPQPNVSSKPNDYSQEAVVVEKLASTIHFEADGTSTRDIHTRIRVQTDAAVQQSGQLVLGYNSGSEHIYITGRVIKPDHSEVAITESAIQDLSSPVSRVAPMYTDTRQKHVTVPSLRPGDILEYDLHSEQYAPLAPNQFWTSYNFNKSSIVLSEELTIDVPSSKYSNVKTRDDLPRPEVNKSNGRTIYKWTHSTLQLDNESHAAKDKKKKKKHDDEVAAVRVTTFKSWDAIAQWYAGLERDRRVPNDAIRANVAELTRGLTTDREKLEALYDYVAKSYRYVSLSFGTGRYQPHAASEIFGNQYGDCKDKNTLLAAMADAAGINVDSVLISSGTKVDPDFPSPAQFDHVISHVRLGEDAVWLDTTTEIAPFGVLLPNLRKKQALVVGSNGHSGLRETPAKPAIANVESVEVVGNINDLGTLSADASFSLRGDAEVIGRSTVRQIPSTRWNEFAKFLAKFAGVDGEVSDVHISDPNDTRHQLEYRFHVVKPNYYNRFEKNTRLTLPMAQIRIPGPEDAEENKPFDVPMTRFEYKLKLVLPKTFGVQLPLGVDQSVTMLRTGPTTRSMV